MMHYHLLRISLILFMLLSSVLGISQKVSVTVTRTINAGISRWQILDQYYRLVFPANGTCGDDSVTFSLDAGKRYLFQVSVQEILIPDTSLYSLSINEEPLLLIISDYGPGDHSFPFFTGVRTDINKIIGGSDADISDFPWQVYFSSGEYMCGGSIIDENWVVTAAHCTKNENGFPIPVSEMYVTAGTDNPFNSREGRDYRVSEVIVHERYSYRTLANDIALLRLTDPITVLNAKPIKLVNDYDLMEGATDPGVISWITGWGLMSVSPDIYPSRLQKAQVPIVSTEQASTVWSLIPATVIMAGFSDGSKDVCNGDSGGPLAVPVAGELKLAGLVSWGSANCETYSAYTRVSAYSDWIKGKTGITEYIPPVPKGDTLICEGTVASSYSVDPVPGASSYEWLVYPDEAGNASGITTQGIVRWNQTYTGPATVKLRAVVNGRLTETSRLDVEVVNLTKLLGQTDDKVTCEKQPVILTVEAEGHKLEYTWYRNEEFLGSSLTGSYSISNSTLGSSGDYKCVISGTCGTVMSDIMNITVLPSTAVTNFTPDITASHGDEITLDVTAEGHDLTYRWEKNGELIPGADENRIVLRDADANTIGLYQAVVTGFCGIAESPESYVYIMKDIMPEDVEIYLWPTITSGLLNVALSTDVEYSIRIFTITGKLIKAENNCSYQTALDVSGLPGGLYIINIKYSGSGESLRFFRE